MNKVRVCLIGAGRVAKVHGSNLKDHIPSAKIVAVVDEREDLAKKLARDLNVSNIFKSHQEAILWNKFDVAVVTTPTFTHRKIVVDLAGAGKHIFCEKPIALSLEEADSMIEECQRHNVKLQIGFMRRFDPEFILAKKRLNEGVIGEPLLIKSTGRGPGLPPEWALDMKKSGGMLAEVGSHDFDSLMWFAESRLEWVEATAANYRCSELKEKYPFFYDTAVVLGSFENGKIGIIDISCPVRYGYDARMEILGSEGMMVVGDVKMHDFNYCVKDKGIVNLQYSSWRQRFKEAYVEEMRYFIKSVIDNVPPLVSGEDGKRSLAAVIASNLSIKKGRRIKVTY